MDWNQIKDRVEESDNVCTFTMEELRDAHGAAKLGVHVREEIKRSLAGMGLGNVPTELPSYQDEQVRLYKKGTPVGILIDAVLSPGEQNDKSLAERVSNDGADYAAIIERIRELVSQ
jgi:hypothetical protein